MKNTLFIICTHGDESATIAILKNVIQKYGEEDFYRTCDYVIANPRALEKNVRFTETDLNRIYPGNPDSELYEERRAAELFIYAKQFKCVIDLHTTVADSRIFTLITKETKNSYILASKLFPTRVVLWESISGRKTGPITSFLDCACEIECSIVYPEYAKDLERLLTSAIDVFNNEIEEKEWYRVIGSMSESEGTAHTGLKDFRVVDYGGKSLYPLLTGRYSGKACYLMEKIDDPLQANTDRPD